MVAQFARRVGHAGTARAEQVRQFTHGGEQVEESEPRHGAAHKVVREERSQCGYSFAEVVAVPESRPRNQDEQQAGFEQQRDKKKTSEQGGLLFGLELGESQDAIRDVAEVPGLGLELDKHGERP